MTGPAWDETVDLAVVGAGAGGMTAALVAAHLGLSVLVLEKTDQVGGTTSTSAGTIWVPGTHQSERAGVPDDAAEARRYLSAEVPGSAGDPVVEAFLSSGAEAIDFLEQRTAVHFAVPTPYPDYHPDQLGASLGGRALVALPFDGRILGRDFRLVRPPRREFMVLGGMLVGKADIAPLVKPFASMQSFRHAAGLLLRHASDRLSYARGTRLVMGNALVARLLHSLRLAKVPIVLNAQVVELFGDGSQVSGLSYREGGTRRTIRTRRGVVLATGGFSGSAAWRARMFGARPIPYSVAFAGDAGDGLDLGRAAGGKVSEDHASPAFWMPSSVIKRPDGSESVFPHIFLDRAKPGLIAVNQAGRRFVNEAASYHDFVLGMLHSNETVPTIPAWLICDREFLHRYGMGMVHPGTRNTRRFRRNGYLEQAGTLTGLARQVGVDPAGLEQSVREHNTFAADGIDRAFGKGSTALNRHNGDPEHQPNPCLRAITRPPYYAVAVYPADLATSHGLAADADARVLDVEGQAIAGLYVCGNDMASVMRGAYPGPGVTLGPAIIFGFRAATHAAARKVLSGWPAWLVMAAWSG